MFTGSVLTMLVEDLQPLAANWKSLGTQLKIKRSELRNIEGGSMVQKCFENVIEEWLNNVDTPHTKDVLVKVLLSRPLGEMRLANHIKSDEGILFDFMCGYCDIPLY